MKCVEVIPERKEDIQNMLNAKIPTMILFRMQMCPHCIAMKEAWDHAKSVLTTDPGIQIAEVEYQNMNMLPPSLQNIRGFPTLQIIEDKKVTSEYYGDRSFQSILDFAISNSKKAKKSRSVAKKSASPPAAKKSAPKKKKVPV